MATYRTPDAIDEIRHVVRECAAAQGGVFRREHLLSWGIDPTVTFAMRRRGEWVRLRHGVYCDRDVLESAEGRRAHVLHAAAAIWALRGQALAFGPTAALIHNLPFPDDQPAAVTLVREPMADPRGAYRRLGSTEGLLPVVTRRRSLGDDDRTHVDGIPTVSRILAAFSAAAECSIERAVCLLDAAAWQDDRVLDEFDALLRRWPMLRGIGMLRHAVPLARVGAQSPLESISRLRLMGRGLDEPELQVAFHDRAGLVGYADMTWRRVRVIGECDGLAKYQAREDLIAEKKREDRLRALGFVVVRWTWDEIVHDTHGVAHRIRVAARRQQAGVAS